MITTFNVIVAEKSICLANNTYIARIIAQNGDFADNVLKIRWSHLDVIQKNVGNVIKHN